MVGKAKELQEMSEKPRFFTALRSVQNDKMSFSYTFQEIISTTDKLALAKKLLQIFAGTL